MQSSHLSEQQIKTVLRQRAIKLAQPEQADDSNQHKLPYSCFTLAGKPFALRSEYIKTLIPVSVITPIPCTPPFLAGITSLRGQITAVYHLADLLDLPRPNNSNNLLILASESTSLALLVDTIDEAVELPEKAITPSNNLLGIRSHDYVEGMSNEGLTLLSATAILDDQQLKLDLTTR